MALNRYPPGREADLITAAQTFHDVANVAPSTYSLTAGQLTTLATKLTDEELMEVVFYAQVLLDVRHLPSVVLANESQSGEPRC